jgi:hypothetical protein
MRQWRKRKRFANPLSHIKVLMRLKGWRFFKEKEAARDRVAVRRCEKLAQPVSRDAM